MYHDLLMYFNQNILLRYKQYLNISKNKITGLNEDLRSLIDLSTHLYHFKEQLNDSLNTTYGVNYYYKKNLNYKLIKEVANTAKHGTPDSNTIILNKTDIYECLVFTEYKDKEGLYNNKSKKVFVKLNDGSIVDLSDKILDVINMWITELNLLNISNMSFLKPVEFKIPKRSKKARDYTISAIQGWGINMPMKFRKYNYNTNKIDDVDLTGSEFTFSIYKPSYTLAMEFVDDKTSKTAKFEIEVDDQFKKKFDKLKSVEEKFNLALALAVGQGKVKILNQPPSSNPPVSNYSPF